MTPRQRRPEPVFHTWRRPEGEFGAMDNRELRRRCTALVADLDLPAPFDVAGFCAQLGRERGRPIHQLAVDLPAGGPCGLLVSTDDAEFVLFERKISAWHQEHIVLHELGHLLWGHHRVTAPHASTQLLPHLDPAMVNRVLGRTAYSELEERQAELVASLIRERADRRSPEVAGPAPTSGDAPLLQRVEESFHGRSLTPAPPPAGRPDR